MSTLFERVERLYHAGHADAAPELWIDPRLQGDEEFKPAAVLARVSAKPTSTAARCGRAKRNSRSKGNLPLTGRSEESWSSAGARSECDTAPTSYY